MAEAVPQHQRRWYFMLHKLSERQASQYITQRDMAHVGDYGAYFPLAERSSR